MDCNAARQFLQFVTPAGTDLDGPEAAELNDHLAHCSACNALAQRQRHFDQQMTRAMKAVEVPRGLREHLLQTLQAQELPGSSRWRLHAIRGLALAASLLLVVAGWYLLSQPRLVSISAESVLHSYNYSRPGPAEGTEQLRQLHLTLPAPEFNFAYLVGAPALAILPGTQHTDRPVQVPQLVFVKGQEQAIVYIVDRRRYQIEELESSQEGYHYSLDLYQDPEQPTVVYLVLHTGKNWDWLRANALIEP